MWSPSLTFLCYCVSYVKRSMECQTISCYIFKLAEICFWPIQMMSQSFSVHKCSWKNIFYVCEINYPVSNTKNNVCSGTFYFLMGIIYSGSKASFFKQDAFINWQWKSAWLDIIIQLTCYLTQSWHTADTIWYPFEIFHSLIHSSLNTVNA